MKSSKSSTLPPNITPKAMLCINQRMHHSRTCYLLLATAHHRQASFLFTYVYAAPSFRSPLPSSFTHPVKFHIQSMIPAPYASNLLSQKSPAASPIHGRPSQRFFPVSISFPHPTCGERVGAGARRPSPFRQQRNAGFSAF